MFKFQITYQAYLSFYLHTCCLNADPQHSSAQQIKTNSQNILNKPTSINIMVQSLTLTTYLIGRVRAIEQVLKLTY